MPIPKFEDVYPTHSDMAAYYCTNEEPLLHRTLLGKASFQRTGGIASSGEVLLSVLLPRSREVFVADHSYKALAAAFLKTIMLDALGTRGMIGLFLEKPYSEFIKVAGDAAKELPERLRSELKWAFPYPTISEVIFGSLRLEWAMIPEAVIETSRRRLAAVTMIHGDISDLSRFGPMDCLYVSNAFDHLTREKKHPNFDYVSLRSSRKMACSCWHARSISP